MFQRPCDLARLAGAVLAFLLGASLATSAQTARKLVRGLQDRPPDLTPGPPPEIRSAIAFGELLIDARGWGAFCAVRFMRTVGTSGPHGCRNRVD